MAEAERTCDKCGKTFKSDGAWYAKHALSCDGTPATSGRIKTAERTPPAGKRARPVSPPHVRSKKRKSAVQRKKKATVAAGVTPAQMVAALRAERDKIDVAIASIEALA